MGLMKFDRLNVLSENETISDERKRISRKKIPIHEYFEDMQISEEQKQKRIRLANLLLADVLFLFALSKGNNDKHYLVKSFQNRYTESVKSVAQQDKELSRYIRKVCENIVDTTLKDTKKPSDLTDSAGTEYRTSIDRAMNIAENEANSILNNEEYRSAIKNGCTKKKWISFGDERVRTDHADVDGEVVDIYKPFHVGGYLMMFPKDDSLGAGLEEIVNCRCSVEYLQDRVIVLDDKAIGTEDSGKKPTLFVDVTEEYLKAGKVNLGKVIDEKEYEKEGQRYCVDGKNVVLDYSESERKIAENLAGLLGANVKMIPRVLFPQGISTPDIFINNEAYDIKEPIGKGKAVIYNMVSKKKRQANNFVIDISHCPLSENEIRNQVADVYRSSHTRFIDKIILCKNGNILNIYKRIKKEE
ncbi:phage minor head protein [Butyribacter intestini]|uniref:CdiA C-terminal domain-containing protein n=1 Tax=Butyribacter intestini TaxID=1703332 RepID=UPI00204CEB72|nr:phage minor head protein [Butyribacter intestini]DAV57237.1 MAG TPA: minor capsid component [Caudoviricetes sp.]